MAKHIAAALAAALALAGAAAAAEPTWIGVMNSHQFRWSDAPSTRLARYVPERLTPGPRLSPLTFAEQLESFGWRVIHLPVVDDPETGRWARGRVAHVRALRQPGLKVIDPRRADPEALCFTLMTCLIDVEGWSRTRPGHEPVIVLLQARAVAPDGRVAGVKRRFGGAPDTPAPTWRAIAQEVETALPEQRRATTLAGADGRLIIVAMGGRGPAPARAPFVTGGEGGVVDLFNAPATPAWAIEQAVGNGRFVGALNVGWRDGAPDEGVGARQAAAKGAHMLVFGADAARRPPARPLAEDARW
ncbi:MAG: Ca2+-dependent phosphoinositide-specific phospholipase C [Caulobacterales bacterium]|nr:Ca2+-dependent phosphoinositide-specific phospholipase C [Caulobacterales bacterium]